MCNPMLVAVGAGALSTAASSSAANSAANAEAEHNSNIMRYRNQKALNDMDWQRRKYAQMQENYYRVGEAVQKNARAQYQDTMVNMDQTLASTYGRIKQFATATARGKSMVVQAAAEGNVGGLTVDEALGEFEIAEATNAMNENINLKNYITQQYRTMDAIQANAQMQANQATPQPLAPIAPVQPMPTVMGGSILTALAAGFSTGFSIYGAAGGWDPSGTNLGNTSTDSTVGDPASFG